ncbi:SDR family NAD(P)-dependent oxidoreductase [Sediminibacterium sp. TEGAF015]|uniref:SDR family NAD(P)-dependent oxidoreductase n=1 Tax=Sediminibacterium sp. TEGAF015 TaxID=575378 RepID=UPI00220F6234|nr:SDR family oxidoreductase [Sediminibacterium sp. TEGAF015]BDQ12945.1 dehydrogenase [Sediminibacterium sp. TEGAF015]
MQIKEAFSLEGKVALITGASKGIGEAIAHYFASSGASVVINSRKQEELDKVAASIQGLGGKCIGIAGNAGDTEACKILIDKTIEVFGGIDILVNNAASNPVFGPVVESESWAFDKIMNVNVKAPFELGKMAYPIMKARGGGSVINISSIAGITPDPGLGLYSVSKAALNMLTKVTAKEWGKDGIRVNAICPGLIKTKFSEALWQDEKWLNRFVKMAPIARMGTVDEIAALALFLAAPASGYCTGTIFTADGGVTI